MGNHKMILSLLFPRLLDVALGLRLPGFHLDFAVPHGLRSLDVGLDVDLDVGLVVDLGLGLGLGGCFLNLGMALHGSLDLRLLDPGSMSVGHHLRAQQG
jgi:hypothetical protein